MNFELNVRSIDHAALLIALLVTLVVVIAGSIVSAVYHFFWWGLLVICVSTYVVTYYFTRLVIRRGNLIEKVTARITDEVERLEEMERFRREYLGDFAHEIKTPVFNVQGYIQTLLDGGLEDEAVNRLYLERAEKSVERIIAVVTFLDEISRLESGALEMEMEEFDLRELVEEVVEGLEIQAEGAGVSVIIEGGTVEVEADRKYVGQVLVNLIGNGIRYGRQGGWVRVRFVEEGGALGSEEERKVRVEVADNGEGIDAEDLPRIFERFYRADTSRSREKGGTGLGLAIVKHIIEAHGEGIEVESEPGVGSVFGFTLARKL